ncbi:MAG: response regulator [Nanoarchaeota archaeon]|nr:response regulator [Nanoarchaeota archaeon]MBU0962409.1 response regulator [Nanoarchaeota archaeon]
MTEEKPSNINTEYCLVNPKISENNKNPLILFCDEQKYNANSLKSLLRRYHINVDPAYCLFDAVDKLENNFEYKLVISDIDLPDGKGLDVVSKIRKVYEGPLYLISILECDDQELKGKLLEAGANKVYFGDIGKTIDSIIEEIQKLFNSQDNSK